MANVLNGDVLGKSKIIPFESCPNWEVCANGLTIPLGMDVSVKVRELGEGWTVSIDCYEDHYVFVTKLIVFKDDEFVILNDDAFVFIASSREFFDRVWLMFEMELIDSQDV